MLLITKDKKVPLLWRALANKFSGKLNFATHADFEGKTSKALGLGKGKKSKVGKPTYKSKHHRKRQRRDSGLNEYRSNIDADAAEVILSSGSKDTPIDVDDVTNNQRTKETIEAVPSKWTTRLNTRESTYEIPWATQ